jgi:hypothetical protein
MVKGALLTLLIYLALSTCKGQQVKNPYQVPRCPYVAPKVYPWRYFLRSRFNGPFIAHLRFNVTKSQRLFTDTSTDLKQTMRGYITDDRQFELTSGSFKASIPISYHKVYSVTFAASPTFFTNINLNESHIIRPPSTLTIYSTELLVFWYKTIML